MRNVTLLDNVNAGVQNISVPVNLETFTNEDDYYNRLGDLNNTI